jgi:hypothetical protein
MDDDNKTLDEYFANDWAHIVIDQLKQWFIYYYTILLNNYFILFIFFI